jgi:hypothetical protein
MPRSCGFCGSGNLVSLNERKTRLNSTLAGGFQSLTSATLLTLANCGTRITALGNSQRTLHFFLKC